MLHIRVKPLVAIFGLWILVSACSDVVDLKTDGVPPQLVIYGRITDGRGANEVKLALTSPINGNQAPVTGARIDLIENGVPIAEYRETTPGLYAIDPSLIVANTGETYEISVILRDGTRYRSLPAAMPATAAIDNLRYDASVVEVEVNEAGLEVKKNLIQLYSDTEIIDPESDFYLRWNITEAFTIQERLRVTLLPPPPCYVINDITGQKVRLFNGAALKVPVIPDQLLVSTEIDSRFAFRYFYSVILTTMDEAAYEYWSLIDEISNTRGTIFDRPAAPVQGNLVNADDPDEVVLGYFEVVASDTTRVSLRSEDIDFFIQVPCPFADSDREPAYCTNCILFKNSTYTRPYYWD